MHQLTYQTYLEAERTRQLTPFFQILPPLVLQRYTVTASFCYLASLAHLLNLNALVPDAPCRVFYALCCQVP